MAGANEKQSQSSVGELSLAEARQRNTELLGEDIKKVSTKALQACEEMRQHDLQRMIDAENVAKTYIDLYAGPVSKSLAASQASLRKCLSENEARMQQQAKGMDPEGIARRASEMASLYLQRGTELEEKVARGVQQHCSQATEIQQEMRRRINTAGKIKAFEEILRTDV